ncbi:hypothetical protein QBC32DRAFT_340397 [Pseudoneurospora amorphoporcata]|uniref:Uncharacterized protein n=1 Tax=Pseudoneurospora amorphoporcata TaxID=241081 RepID=A0AAN6SFX6_9PEZI|nr:hypothetical protein QBC32DRAFT_340397 [Pseudoneurospora amorphoporcata]
MAHPTSPESGPLQLVRAPERPEFTGKKSVFLAGTTSKIGDEADWRDNLARQLSRLPITVINPVSPNWIDWPEEITFAPFREQVEWELDMQERADIVLIYYGPGTLAPVSLLELGLCACTSKAIVCCHKEYKKRGHVQIVAKRYGIEFLENEKDMAAAVIRKLGSLNK